MESIACIITCASRTPLCSSHFWQSPNGVYSMYYNLCSTGHLSITVVQDDHYRQTGFTVSILYIHVPVTPPFFSHNTASSSNPKANSAGPVDGEETAHTCFRY